MEEVGIPPTVIVMPISAARRRRALAAARPTPPLRLSYYTNIVIAVCDISPHNIIPQVLSIFYHAGNLYM